MGIPASFLECASTRSANDFAAAQTFSAAVACASTLAVTGAATLSSTCAITGAVTCASTLAVTGATTLSSTLAVTGAATFSGGITGSVRTLLPFGMLNVAAGDNATPASSTPVQIFWCGASGLTTCGFVAMRAGSLVGLSANLNAAAAGSNLIVGVYKNGTIINASAIVTLASATSDVKAQGTFAHGAYTFVAGDVIDVRIRTGSAWSATTADLSVAVEIES